MDANDRNDATIRERDAKLARRLGEALDQLNPQGAGTCPDAEVIAAYSERALGTDELAQCEDHFATCARCRNILKVLAAASDAPLVETEVARLGQRVATIRAPVEITAGAAKLPRSKAAAWSTRWLAPALGIAAVLTVWFIMRPPWRAMDRSGSTTLIAQAPRQEMPESAPLAVDRAEKAAPAAESPSAKTAAPNSNSELATNDQLKSKDAIRDTSPNDSVAKSYSIEKKEAAPLVSEDKARTLGAPPPSPALAPTTPPQSADSSAVNSPVASPRARAQLDSAASAANNARPQASQSVEVNEATPQVETTNGILGAPIPQQPGTQLPLNGRQFHSVIAGAPGLVSATVLKSASGVVLWRIGLAGAIERSTDVGKKWGKQKSPSKENWLSGAAVSDTVCWIAGSNGAIARTTDGERWESIAPPAEAVKNNGKLPDWTGVTALDAQSATVTAGDGTRFATSDGGKTWQRQ